MRYSYTLAVRGSDEHRCASALRIITLCSSGNVSAPKAPRCLNVSLSRCNFRVLGRKYVAIDRSIPHNFGKCSTFRAPTRAGEGRPGPWKKNRQEIDAIFEVDSFSQPSGPRPTMLDRLNQATKWVVSALTAGVLVWRHDTAMAWCVIGAVLNGGNSKLLKRLLNVERPATAEGRKSDPGMPSSHAQSLGFLATSASIAVLHTGGGGLAMSFLILGAASVMAWLRVATGLHTPLQVVVGGMVGSFTALLWSLLWERNIFPALASETAMRVVEVHDKKMTFLGDVVQSCSGPLRVFLWGACLGSILLFGSQVVVKWSRKQRPSPKPSQEKVDNKNR